MYLFLVLFYAVAFRIYDMDNDGFISNGELFQVLKMMVGNNLKETQLQQIVDKTVINADKDGDGKISFSEFCAVSIVNCLNCCLNSTLFTARIKLLKETILRSKCDSRFNS